MKGTSPAVVRQHQLLKYVNNVSYVDHLCSVKHVPNVQTVAKDLPVGPDINSLGKLGKPWGRTKGPTNVERGLHPPLPDQTKINKVTDQY